MTDTSAYDRLLGRARGRRSVAKRNRRYVETHRALIAEIKAAQAKDLLAIVERMHAEADADKRRAA